MVLVSKFYGSDISFGLLKAAILMNKSYDGIRSTLVDFAGINFDHATVLDVGCYRGSNSKYLKSKFNDVFYVGVENDSIAISKMDPCVDEVVKLDLDFFFAEIFAPRIFDVVILGDVLEHLKDPRKLLEEIKKITNENSTLLVSVPNVQYYETFLMLFIGRFPRRERAYLIKLIFVGSREKNL